MLTFQLRNLSNPASFFESIIPLIDTIVSNNVIVNFEDAALEQKAAIYRNGV